MTYVTDTDILNLMNTSETSISIQPGYVLVQHPAEYEVISSEMPALFGRVATACETEGCRKVLVAGPETKVRLSVLGIYDLGEELARLGLKIAFSVQHDASIRDIRFFETVASNRGGDIRFFDSEQQAKDWLGVL